ncbi:MAG: hypothetical protein MAG715_01056 [Methanonatronarchaeales archaeon]|nr:hypothetical protein [Methanonatronarchaeales archaeon]
MRLQDARRLPLDELLRARDIVEDSFSPRDSRLDGRTLGSALEESGIELAESARKELIERVWNGPLLTSEELFTTFRENLPRLLGDGWEPLDMDSVVGRMYAFHELDDVAMSSGRDTMVPVAIEQRAGKRLGTLLLSVEKIEEVVRDERSAEKRRSPVLTEIDEEALYARHMTSPLASVESVDPLLVTTDPQPQLDRLCEKVGVEVMDFSPEALADRDLEAEIDLVPR